jgi:hypothetical protein
MGWECGRLAMEYWPNLIAYTETGLISFFPPPSFQQLGAYSRAAFMLRCGRPLPLQGCLETSMLVRHLLDRR